jgi:hypothetical protein
LLTGGQTAQCRPSTLTSSSETLFDSWSPSRPTEMSLGLRLSWSSSASAPPPFNRLSVHSRQAEAQSQTEAWADMPKHIPGTDGANRQPCSVPVVSHHLDGLLHSVDCRLVASCCRSWGSRAFPSGRLPVPAQEPIPGHVPAVLAARFVPSKEFPSSAAVPHHCGRCLPAVDSPQGGGTSRDTCFQMPQPMPPRD